MYPLTFFARSFLRQSRAAELLPGLPNPKLSKLQLNIQCQIAGDHISEALVRLLPIEWLVFWALNHNP